MRQESPEGGAAALETDPRKTRNELGEGTGSVVDCRGQLCPKPIFVTKKALARGEMGQLFEVIVDDDGSKENVLRYCWNHGQEVRRSYAEGREFHIIVRKSPEKVSDKPLPAVGPCGTRWD